jgi:hypothetical protein
MVLLPERVQVILAHIGVERELVSVGVGYMVLAV